MKIIKKGALKSEKDIKTDCGSCKTIFEFKPSVDAQYISDQRDGDAWKVKCPVCSKDIYISVNH